MGHFLAQSASLQAHRMTGGNSGWSAPPEVFREKSLLEIEQEKKSKMNQSKKNKTAPKMDTLRKRDYHFWDLFPRATLR